MPKLIKLPAETIVDGEEKEVKLIIKKLSHRQKRAFEAQVKTIIQDNPELTELLKKEQDEDGLTPEEMAKALELQNTISDQEDTINIEIIRKSLEKTYGEYKLPDSLLQDNEEQYKAKLEKIHNKISDMFSSDLVSIAATFALHGTVNVNSEDINKELDFS